ncbi:diguanylate cyclase (GGDEF) domain-containing protein [Fibrobacter sp. UWEL]|nr:diguanylate cyclase (GGDEF) domain-containing protein [Fibrobacter sp. UWEL]
MVRKRLNMTGIMLDLNGFKAINDTQGHSVGDQALISAAEIFRRGVEDLGIVIRYAGDEFIIMINSQDDIDISTCMSNIRDGFQEFNKNSGASYKLSVSMGFCKLNLDAISVDEFLNEIDSRMYEDKKAYYAKNTQVDRRRS